MLHVQIIECTIFFLLSSLDRCFYFAFSFFAFFPLLLLSRVVFSSFDFFPLNFILSSSSSSTSAFWLTGWLLLQRFSLKWAYFWSLRKCRRQIMLRVEGIQGIWKAFGVFWILSNGFGYFCRVSVTFGEFRLLSKNFWFFWRVSDTFRKLRTLSESLGPIRTLLPTKSLQSVGM